MRYLVIILVGIALGALLSTTGCEKRPPSSEEMDSRRVQEQQEQYAIAQPVPKFDYSLERDIVAQLYRARNERVATHTVWRGDLSNIEGDCPSIGYPIPYDTSLTNPMQLQVRGVHRRATYHLIEGVVEQAEPNGIFASKNSTATWVRCVVDGHDAPIYIEGKVTAYPYPVKVDYERNRVARLGDSKPTVVIRNRSR